jgi:ABC-type uncharacterized transport system substrate-binding protein
LEPLLQATHTVPIVFVQIADPVGAGYVSTLNPISLVAIP